MNRNIFIRYYGLVGGSPQFAFGWYRHSPRHPYWGFEIYFIAFSRQLNFSFIHKVDRYLEHHRKCRVTSPGRPLFPWGPRK
jgi:hypothetical protein